MLMSRSPYPRLHIHAVRQAVDLALPRIVDGRLHHATTPDELVYGVGLCQFMRLVAILNVVCRADPLGYLASVLLTGIAYIAMVP
jgi:hypothetical protein